MSQQHSSPSPNSEERPNRFALPQLNQPTANLNPGEAATITGNHRAASQPPRSSSSASNNVLPSPTTASRSPWSQSQNSTAKHPRDRYLSPTRTSGIPMPSQTRSSSFSGAGIGAHPHSFSGLGTSSGGPGYFSRFDSTLEDDESLLDDPHYAVEEDGGEDDDVDAMIGRIRPSADQYDEYSDSPVYSRKGVGITGASGLGRYGVGKLPPSLSSSLSPSQLPGTAPLMSPSPRSSNSSSLASQLMRDDVRGRTYAPDLSRSRSQSLATTTVGRVPAGLGAAGMYGLPSHNPHGYSRDTSGLGSTMASWNGNDSDHSFSLLRERLDSSRSRYGSYNEYSDYGDKPHDTSNQSPFLRDVTQIMRDDAPLRELWDHAAGGAPPPRGLGLRNSLSRAYSGGGGFNSGARSGGYTSGGVGGTELEDIPGSGATSRRHSVSIIQPMRRGSGLQGELTGSAVDDEYEYEYGQTQGGLGIGRSSSSGFGALGMAGMGRTVSMSGGVHPHVGPSSHSVGAGRGSLMISDDDLLDAGAPISGLGMGVHGGMHPVDALNNNLGRMNLNDINQSLYQHQQQQSALEITQQRRGSVSPGTGAGSLPHEGSSPGHHQYHEKNSSFVSQEHTPQQHTQLPPSGNQYSQGPNGLGAGSSYASRARSSSQSHQQGGTSPTMGRGMGIPPQGFYSSQHPPPQPQQGPNYSQHHAAGMPRRISNASGGGHVLDMSYGIGPHGHGQGHHLGSGHPHQTHPHVQHAPQHQQPQPPPGRGLPLSAVPPTSKLFIVEFKAGRTDLFYLTDADKAEIMRIEAGYAATQSQNHTNGDGNAHASFEGAEGTDYPIKVGDLVIVEADRGRDLGRVVNDNITVEEVEAWLDAGRSASGQLLDLSQQSNQQWGDSPMPTPISPTGVYAGIPPPSNPNSISSGSGGGSGSKKEINPKQIYGKAGPAEASLLAAKMGDEMKALQLCQSKVRAKKLPMEVVDAEYQWDRRKLTFYFVADKRIDFRELVRELFRLYKTRIWMASLQGGGGFEQ